MMNDNLVAEAVDRLGHILPLVDNQKALDKPLQDLHKAILRAYVEKGHTLSCEEMAQQVDDIDAAVDLLKQKDLVLFDNHGEPTGAYPFTMEKREHQITVNGYTVHCMCALDALAVSPMFNLPTEITSCCYVTSEPIHIRQHGSIINGNAQNIYFGINWSAASENSCCADSLCTEMLFLNDKVVAENWQKHAPEHREIFNIHDAIEFAARFFVPLLNNSIAVTNEAAQ